MEIILVQIKNGWLLVHGQDTLFCKDGATLHKELEFLIGREPMPEPPKPPTENKPEGVRQFDDED